MAVSGDSADPGVPRLVNVERGITQAKRTVAVLSDAYLANNEAEFENLVAQTIGVDRGEWRLIPVSFGTFDRNKLPARLSLLTALQLDVPQHRDLTAASPARSRRGDRSMQRLISALEGPVPQAG